MPDFRILWTALPRSVEGNDLIVDVFASPRLGIDVPPGTKLTLNDFPSLATWPNSVANHLTFEVEFSGGGRPVAATRVPLTPAESDVDLDAPAWKALFPASSAIVPWSMRTVSSRPFYSYPADWVADYLQSTYAAAARHGADPTTDDFLDQLVKDAGDLIDTRPGVERAEPTSDSEGGETSGGGPPPTANGLRGCLFAPVAWLVWILRWLWHKLIGGPSPGPSPKAPTPSLQPVTTTPLVVTYTSAPRPPAPVPPSLAAVEQHVGTTGVTPPGGWTPPGSGLSPNAVALAAAWRFFRRPESEPTVFEQPDVKNVPPAPQPPDWDFHQRLGVLGDYPLLLRRLGMVIRLQVPAPAIPPTTVRVIPRWDGQPMPQRDLTPRTRCFLSGEVFAPEPRPGSDFTDGVLNLSGAAEGQTSPNGYRLAVIDTDGAALKLIHTAASLVRYRWLRGNGFVRAGVRSEGLSSLRSAGIAIVRSGRASSIRAQLQTLEQAAPEWKQNAPEELFADDIVRGFQVEVQETTKNDQAPWRSLCKRIGRYHLLNDTGAVVDTFDLADHGYVKRSAATSVDDQDSPLYVHEALVRWDGWSLVAPRPGRKIRSVTGTRVEADGRVVPTQDEETVAPIPEPSPELHLATIFRPTDGSLPKLRIGSKYRFRLPWVDLAGEGVAIRVSAPVSSEVVYRRFEPMAPPALLPRDPYTLGESLEVLVIRSTVDQGTNAYVSSVLEVADPAMKWRETATRHVFPAKVTQEQAEQHGMFDRRELSWRWEASLRADNTFDDPSLVDLDDGATPIDFGTPATVVIEPSQPEVDGRKERYAVNRAGHTLPTPYLPDPFASAIAFRDLPGSSGLPAGGAFTSVLVPGTSQLVSHVPFQGTWPAISSFRIRVAERPGAVDPESGIEIFTNPADPPQWDEVNRVLTLFLAKGQVAVVPYSTQPSDDGRPSLGPVAWVSPASSDLQGQIELGCHWLVSPARTMSLVHAVQRPLRPGVFISAEATKDIGSTVAKIAGRMAIDPATTGTITLLAAWTDETDDGTSHSLVAHDASMVLESFNVPVELGEGSPTDTKFPPPPVPGDTAATVDARHEFGDTRHRLVRYRLRASTRFREYFPASLAGATAADGSDGFSRVGAERVVSVPNSAPPIAPGIRYLMPSFGWDIDDPDSPTAWSTFTRRRSGGGLRVFLDRPWFTSGPGEQLGVVIPVANGNIDDTRHSRLGVDPTTSNLTDPTIDPLVPSVFTGGDAYPGVKLEDGATVDVIAYAPALDTTRNQWYADVTVDMSKLPNTYMPFMRLALVRFQPDSVEGTAASKIVLADFAQLAPDREFTATVIGKDVKVVVRGRGPIMPNPNLMLIALDEADVPDPDELAWRPIGSTSGAATIGDDLLSRLADAVPPMDDVVGFHWERTLAMPGLRGDRTLRVVVRELEIREADEESTFGGPHREEVGELAGMLRRHVIPRIVYADAVRLA
jgi:hypothetical protein